MLDNNFKISSFHFEWYWHNDWGIFIFEVPKTGPHSKDLISRIFERINDGLLPTKGVMCLSLNFCSGWKIYQGRRTELELRRDQSGSSELIPDFLLAVKNKLYGFDMFSCLVTWQVPYLQCWNLFLAPTRLPRHQDRWPHWHNAVPKSVLSK